MIDYTSTQAVMALAAVSALCRAGLNLIDRHQIGVKKLSVVELSLYNNAVPALALAAVFIGIGMGPPLLQQFGDWRSAAFGALIQAVAYGFSSGFRLMTVSQVTVAAKMADLFIPLGVFAVTKRWDWANYAFAVVTTLVYMPILLQRVPNQKEIPVFACLTICALLVLQGTAAPWLKDGQADTSSLSAALLFSTAVILWRTVWSMLPLLRRTGIPLRSPWDVLKQPSFGLRALLTVATQLTFILAVSSLNAAAAWPILSSAGLLAMVLSALVLHEKAPRYQTSIVLAVATLSVVRFVVP